MTPRPGRVAPGWLLLRGPADSRARTDHAESLATRFAAHLGDRCTGGRAARLVDVGAGTGAGARWLRPRLTGAQDWRLVDPDADLLAVAEPVLGGWAHAVVAGVAELPALLAEHPADAVTCQALLDLLTGEELDSLVDATAGCRAAAFWALSVTGAVTVTPQDPYDAVVGAAFDAHQRRDHRLGPDAAWAAVTALRSRGYRVDVVRTPWRLDAADADLVISWLRGRVAAAVEQRPADAHQLERWLRRRLDAVSDGALVATVDHVDVLGLPG